MADNDKLSPYAELIDLIENLPVLVRETRRRRGLSVRAAAEVTGMSFATISRAESGTTLQGDNLVALLRFVGDLPAAASLTQTEVAKKMGLTRSSIANIEAGRQRILAATLVDLAEILGCDPAWLLVGAGYAPRRRPVGMSQADRDQIKRGMSVLKTVAEVLERLAEVGA